VQIGMVGVGRMGANMARRLLRRGHACVAYDAQARPVLEAEAEGAIGVRSLDELLAQLAAARHVWIMVPAARVEETLETLRPLVTPDDALIDGGNSHWADAIRRAEALARRGVYWLDVGTSGGVFGLERGYCLMVGGDGGAVSRLAPIFDALGPGIGAAERTPGRAGAEPSSAERGWLHCGPPGTGQFVKMVHNGIECGIMAAYAEGLNVLRHAGAGLHDRDVDAETTPLAHPERYRYRLDLREIAELWRRGSVIGSWLLDLTAAALVRDPTLEGFAGHVADSGEGRWTMHAAVDVGVPVPVLSAALHEHFASRGRARFANQVLSAMRSAFGGHAERKGGDG
jgi:6-phosphogluconate dehydrogenase